MAQAHRVGSARELDDHGRLIAEVEGREIGVFRVDDELFALGNRCPHQGGPVCMGRIGPAWRGYLDKRGYPKVKVDTEMAIACPWHGTEFDLRSGKCLADSKRRIRTYRAYEEHDDVFVVA